MNNSIEIYSSQDGSTQLNVKQENDTVWFTQSYMTKLFGLNKTIIARHINNCYKKGELDRNIPCIKFVHKMWGIIKRIFKCVNFSNIIKCSSWKTIYLPNRLEKIISLAKR